MTDNGCRRRFAAAVLGGAGTDNDMGACDLCTGVAIWRCNVETKPHLIIAPPQYPTNLYPPGPLWEWEKQFRRT